MRKRRPAGCCIANPAVKDNDQPPPLWTKGEPNDKTGLDTTRRKEEIARREKGGNTTRREEETI